MSDEPVVTQHVQHILTMRLSVDSGEYEVLMGAAQQSSAVPGASCEIGLREGGSSELMLRVANAIQIQRPHIGIDCWGNLPYLFDNGGRANWTYDDAMRRKCLAELYNIALELNQDLLIFPCKDTEFFERYATGVPFYRNGSADFITCYSCVHFDGPHTVVDIMREVQFFIPRLSVGGYLVFDDVDMYNHKPIHTMLMDSGFDRSDTPLDVNRNSPKKASYVKGKL